MNSSAQNVEPFDWYRIFLGDLPWWFTLEVIFRTAIMYVFALGLIRCVSRRAVGQLSLIEFLLVIALGSAVGDPMFYPDVPLLHAMAVVTAVILLNRGILYLTSRSDRIELALEGRTVLLVTDGVMSPRGLKSAALSPEELFERLRMHGIEQLGEVREAYLEQGGHLTVFRNSPPRTGLRLLPPWDLDPPPQFEKGEAVPASVSRLGCASCGTILSAPSGAQLPACSRCQGETWVDAVWKPPEGYASA